MSNWKFWESPVAPIAPQPKSVDTIVAQFNTMIDDLANVAISQQQNIKIHQAMIDDATAQKEAATLEMQRANSVIGKIQALIQ